MLSPAKEVLTRAEALSASSSQYSNFGEGDITQLILDLPLTQPAIPPVSSASSSEKSLGKRKERDMSTSDMSSTTSSQRPFRPAKIPRQDEIHEDAASNPFIDRPKVYPPPPKVDEDPYSPIRYSPSHHLQTWMNSKKLPYCVQYEIARYHSLDKLEFGKVKIEDLTKLAERKTNEAAAPHILKTLMSRSFETDDEDADEARFKNLFAKEHAARTPWKELDREEEALRADPCGALGFNSAGESMDWYGGQVLFHGKLKLRDSGKKNNAPPQYKLTLEPATLGPSTMFTRRFGSQHLFRLKLTKGVQGRHGDELVKFLKRPLLLCGFVYRAFYAKETNVFYKRTNEVFNDTEIDRSKTLRGEMSLLEFLDWHNPISLNSEQKMAKYVSRFALGLSNSVPGLIVHQSNIEFIDDIVSESGANMTDGAGKINRWSLLQIRRRLCWEYKPTAIQVRVFGAKGLLIDDGTNADEFGFVQLTPSQRKIQFPLGVDADPAHRTIDIIRPSIMKAPCRLSVEVIINLAENGVKIETFADLLQQSLTELVEPLLEWTDPKAMLGLWCNVRRLGGVMAARRARAEAGAARAQGLSERDANDDIEPEDEDGFAEFDLAEQAQRSSAWWGDEVSGCPSSLEETIMCLLDSGFTPADTPVVRDKLHNFIKPRVKDYVRSYRMEVPMSASAFLVPDTEGILEEGEVFFKSSQRLFKLPDGTETDIYVGDVLVTRNPCKLPTDVRKWKSVDRPGLHHLVDVIVFSTKGLKRAADWLGGGDYDGDKGIFLYDPVLVDAFTNAPDRLADPPEDMDQYFIRKNEEVKDFLSRTEGLSLEEQIRERQEPLLADARNSGVVGQYSNFHEYATYTLGYDHKETLRLAHMFCMALDGVKTGRTVDPEVFRKDKMKYDKKAPRWKEFQEKSPSGQNESNQAHARRPQDMRKFIMDQLMKQAIEKRDEWLSFLEEFFEKVPRSPLDKDLAAPWNEAEEMAKRWKEEENNDRLERELEIIKAHVKQCYENHRNDMGKKSPTKARATPSKLKSSESFTDQPIEVRQDTLRKLSREFASEPLPDKSIIREADIACIRASFAYIHDFDKMKNRHPYFTRFPWDVAMRELCAIKARALGRHKTVSGDFYEHFNIKHPNKHHH